MVLVQIERLRRFKLNHYRFLAELARELTSSAIALATSDIALYVTTDVSMRTSVRVVLPSNGVAFGAGGSASVGWASRMAFFASSMSLCNSSSRFAQRRLVVVCSFE